MRKLRGAELPPYSANPNILVTEEYQLSPRVLLQPGDKIQVKGEGVCTYLRYCRNPERDVEWIDCIASTKEFRSFRPEQIQRRVKNA